MLDHKFDVIVSDGIYELFRIEDIHTTEIVGTYYYINKFIFGIHVKEQLMISIEARATTDELEDFVFNHFSYKPSIEEKVSKAIMESGI